MPQVRSQVAVYSPWLRTGFPWSLLSFLTPAYPSWTGFAGCVMLIEREIMIVVGEWLGVEAGDGGR